MAAGFSIKVGNAFQKNPLVSGFYECGPAQVSANQFPPLPIRQDTIPVLPNLIGEFPLVVGTGCPGPPVPSQHVVDQSFPVYGYRLGGVLEPKILSGRL